MQPSVRDYPLREPARWREAKPVGRFTLIFGAVASLVGLLLTVMVMSNGAPFVGVVAVSWPIVLGVVVMGLWVFDRMPRGDAELVNAVAVTPSDDRLPDDWVHLVRGRAVPPLLQIGLIAYGAYGVAMSVGAALDATANDDGAAFLAAIIFAAIGVGMLGVAAWAALGRRRLSSFGRAPIGLTLGASGITLVTVRRTRFIAWDDIRTIATPVAARSRDTEHLYRTVRLTAGGGAGESGGEALEVLLPMSRYRLEPAALYTALVTFSQHPGLRELLGTTHGQALLDAWTDAARTRERERR